MSIAANTSITVRRLTADQLRKSDYTGLPLYSNVPCCLQQLSEAPESAFENAAAYKYYQALDFGRAIDIREGDQVVDSAGNSYIVRGAKTFSDPEIGGETELILAKKAS